MNTENYLFHAEFFPCIAWWKEVAACSKNSLGTLKIFISSNEFFPKQTYRNRTVLLSSQGLINLIIPIEKKNSKTQINDIKISYREDWQNWMRKTIFSCYGKSPYFIYFFDDIVKIIMQKHVFLLDLDMASMEYILKVFHLPISLYPYDDSEIPEKNNFLNTFLPKNRIEQGRGIKEYYQCFSDKFPFQTNLSILDLLFNLGNRI